MQSKKLSVIESVVNTTSSFIVGILTQIVIFPFYGLKVSIAANISMTLIFSLTSLIRSYIVRRIFNRLTEKEERKAAENAG